MAFMNPPPSATGDFTPILAYNAKAGRLFVRNRTQTPNGDWEASEEDVTMSQPAFAVDFGRLEIGWTHFTKGAAPQWVMVPYGQQVPPQPPSPGNDEKGKPLAFRQGFRVPVAGNAIGGVRELAGNSGAMITGMNELHTVYEASAEARTGKIPVVKMVNVIGVKAGQSTNFQPVFQVVAWVDRPDVLGRRTVPVPGTGNGHAAPVAAPVQQPAQQPAQHVAPAPTAPQAARPAAMPF